MRLIPVLAALVLTATAAHAQAPVATDLKDGAGKTLGTVTLTEAPKGVLIKIEVAGGLAHGWHGLHIHEKADCSAADFTSAGGHTHPGGERVHGLLNPKASETGDLPNLYVGGQGGAAEVFTTLTTLRALRDADGSAIVVHANADDHRAQPIGGAGARVACAVVR